MPRSSGQIAMPAFATASGRSFTVSRPLNMIDPARRGTSPMIDFIVVVLPAPLRPSRVTTSPSPTWKSTPCSTWLSPYHAFRPFTVNIGASAMRRSRKRRRRIGAEIGGDHLGVA